jgi:hypothetical protein
MGKSKKKFRLEKEDLVKIQTAQSFFLQPGNRVHDPKTSYKRKPKYGKKSWMNNLSD